MHVGAVVWGALVQLGVWTDVPARDKGMCSRNPVLVVRSRAEEMDISLDVEDDVVE